MGIAARRLALERVHLGPVCEVIRDRGFEGVVHEAYLTEGGRTWHRQSKKLRFIIRQMLVVFLCSSSI